MAIENEERKGAAVRTPAWLVPVYVLGLASVYVGERIIVIDEKLQLIFSAAGLLLVVCTTFMRFIPVFRAGKQLASVERVLGLSSLAGLLGVLLAYFGTRNDGALLGLDTLSSADRLSAEGLFTVCWVVLVLCGVLPLIFGEMSLLPMRSAARVEARRVQAAAASGLALALALSYCALFVYSAGKTGAAADYSYFKTSEPGSSTRKMIESFDEPLKITAFFPDVSDVRGEVEGYLKELTVGVPNVELSVVDRYLEPKLATELKVFSDGTIVFKKGETRRSLTVGSEMKSARSKLKTLDRDVQEQLHKLLRSRRVVYLTVGHGELNAPLPGNKEKGRSADILKNLLRKQNFQIRSLGLGQGLGREVPEDAAIVLVLGPQEPFSTEELNSLKRYLDGGGHVLYALDAGSVSVDAPVVNADAQAGTLPAHLGLVALADTVGLTFSPQLLANPSHHVRSRSNDSDRALLITNRFSSHASVSTLSRNASRAAILLARAGSLTSKKVPGLKVDMALRAMSGTFADLNGNYRLDKDTEKKDTFNLVAVVTRPTKPASPHAPPVKDKLKDEEPQEMRAFVLADADVLSDLLLSNFPPNRLLVMDAMRWLGGDESFVGEINNEEDIRLEHTKQKDLAWFYSTILGAPILVLLLGLMWARRSRRSRKAVA